MSMQKKNIRKELRSNYNNKLAKVILEVEQDTIKQPLLFHKRQFHTAEKSDISNFGDSSCIFQNIYLRKLWSPDDY